MARSRAICCSMASALLGASTNRLLKRYSGASRPGNQPWRTSKADKRSVPCGLAVKGAASNCAGVIAAAINAAKAVKTKGLRMCFIGGAIPGNKWGPGIVGHTQQVATGWPELLQARLAKTRIWQGAGH